MGDRALIQLKAGGEVSPVLYLHWSGSNVPQLLDGAARQMARRGADLDYWFARMVGRACNMNGGDNEVHGVGVFQHGKLLVADDSHGDAGVFLVDIDAKVVEYGGGYQPDVANDSPLGWRRLGTL